MPEKHIEEVDREGEEGEVFSEEVDREYESVEEGEEDWEPDSLNCVIL